MLAHHESLHSSVDRASAQYEEGCGFETEGLRYFFVCPALVTWCHEQYLFLNEQWFTMEHWDGRIASCCTPDLRGLESCFGKYYFMVNQQSVPIPQKGPIVHICSFVFQFAGTTARAMVTVIVAPSCVSARVSGCRISLKFTLGLEKATVVRLSDAFVLFHVVNSTAVLLIFSKHTVSIRSRKSRAVTRFVTQHSSWKPRSVLCDKSKSYSEGDCVLQ